MKIAATITFTLLLLIVSAGVFIFWGLEPIPEPEPIRAELFDQSYAQIADEAALIVSNARAELHAPSLSVAVARNGQLLWSAAMGWQNIQQAIPATTKTRYRVGSTSKTITATVLARLVDKGLIALDQPIQSYAPDILPKWSMLTPRQLMSHTAGIVGYDENRDIQGIYQTLRLHQHYSDVADTLVTIDDSDLMFPPGEQFSYSSFDVNLMSVVMQKATGIPFRQLVVQEVTGPLSLKDTYGDDPARRDQFEATFYELIEGEVKPWRNVDLSVKLAGGGFVSRPTDLVLLASAWLDDKFISGDTRAEFWTPQQLNNGQVNNQNYALGWRSDDREINGIVHQRVHHGGVAKGSMNWLVLYPESGLAVNMSINTVVESFSDFAAFEKVLTALFISGGE
ncbi:MAG: serine hydrolase domain-containing protein [bacterium]